MCFCQPKSTVCVNKALSWASIKPLSTQCLSLWETLWWKSAFVAAVQCPCYLLMEGEKGRSEWASIVLCSRQFTHTHMANNTQSLLFYNEINALSFHLCAQHLTVPKASCDQTPHHVLQLLILLLTQCCFCSSVLLFIHIVFSCNKGWIFWGGSNNTNLFFLAYWLFISDAITPIFALPLPSTSIDYSL